MNDGLKDKYRQAVIEILSQCERIEKVVLFGSRAMGTFTTTSDVDIVLFGDKLTLTDQAKLAGQIEELTMPQSVDLLLYRTIESKALLKHIRGYGVQWWPEKNEQRCGAIGDKLYPQLALDRLVNIFDSQRKPVKKANRKLGQYPYYGASGIADYVDSYIFDGEYLLLAEDGENLKTQNTPIAFMAKGKFWVNNHAHILQGNENNNTRFLCYAMQVADVKSYLSGSTRPKLTQGDMKRITVFAPPLPEQKAIAHILGSLDDKIELNRRMNETLEAMAQALFKSWFVDFDPVLDNAILAGNPIPDELEDRAEIRRAILAQDQSDECSVMNDELRNNSVLRPHNSSFHHLFPAEFEHTEEMGWIPKGWSVSTVGEEVEIVGGGTPSTKDEYYWILGMHAFCTPKDMSTLPTKVLLNTERLLTDKGVAKVSSGKLPSGTVLMSSRAPIGYLAIADVPVTVNQGIIAMLKQERFRELFLLCWASCNMEKIMARVNGSTFLEISKKNFRSIPFLLPDNDILKPFNKQTDTITKRLTSCTRNMKELSGIRDALLPKLLSGEIRIPEAEKLAEEAKQMMRDEL